MRHVSLTLSKRHYVAYTEQLSEGKHLSPKINNRSLRKSLPSSLHVIWSGLSLSSLFSSILLISRPEGIPCSPVESHLSGQGRQLSMMYLLHKTVFLEDGLLF